MGKTSDAVAEGLQIALAAARLLVRNHILVETIAHDVSFEVESMADFARDSLRMLAQEQEDAGLNAKRLRKRAWGKYSDSLGTHDYRDRDTRNLRKRQKQYLGVAEELRSRADDPGAVHRLVEESRDAAWGDVEANLARRLDVEGMRADIDPEYDNLRDARMNALIMIDLPRLEARTRRRDAAAT